MLGLLAKACNSGILLRFESLFDDSTVLFFTALAPEGELGGEDGVH